jgi:hypothetical protein
MFIVTKMVLKNDQESQHIQIEKMRSIRTYIIYRVPNLTKMLASSKRWNIAYVVSLLEGFVMIGLVTSSENLFFTDIFCFPVT